MENLDCRTRAGMESRSFEACSRYHQANDNRILSKAMAAAAVPEADSCHKRSHQEEEVAIKP